MMKMMIGVTGGLHRDTFEVPETAMCWSAVSLCASVSLQVDESFWTQWVTDANLFTQRYCSSPPPPQY